MRLMAPEKGGETPLEKYVRFKNNINLWEQEMDSYHLTKEEKEIVSPYFKPSYGVPPSQEFVMKILMDKNVCGFSLGESNAARKVISKKQMNKVNELKEKILSRASSENLGNYVFDCGISPQLGYSFSVVRMARTHRTFLSKGYAT